MTLSGPARRRASRGLRRCRSLPCCASGCRVGRAVAPNSWDLRQGLRSARKPRMESMCITAMIALTGLSERKTRARGDGWLGSHRPCGCPHDPPLAELLEAAGDKHPHRLGGGVDTHADTHHAAVVLMNGRQLADRQFQSTAAGYAELLAWLRALGRLHAGGVEDTGSYGAADREGRPQVRRRRRGVDPGPARGSRWCGQGPRRVHPRAAGANLPPSTTPTDKRRCREHDNAQCPPSNWCQTRSSSAGGILVGVARPFTSARSTSPTSRLTCSIRHDLASLIAAAPSQTDGGQDRFPPAEGSRGLMWPLD